MQAVASLVAITHNVHRRSSRTGFVGRATIRTNEIAGGDVTTYLVTGAAGFIGSNIVEELVTRGADVRAFDNLSTGKLENLQPFMGAIQFIQGDLTKPEDLVGP